MLTVTRSALLLGTSLMCLAACQRAEQAAVTAKSAAQAQMTPTLSTTDATFINMAGITGMEEVAFARLAQTKASNPAVRRFAEQMVADHTAANQQLMTLGQGKQLPPATSMDATHTQLYQQLQSLQGAAFDRAYMTGQVQDHVTAVKTFETEAQDGTDPQVRGFARQTLPTLQHHLKMARALVPRG